MKQNFLTNSISFNVGNHKNIFNDARVPWSEYRYYDPKTVGLDFEGMIADIKVNILTNKDLLKISIS